MVNEIFLSKNEKEKLSQRRSDYINSAIEKSDKTLQKIIKKRLLTVKEKKQKDYEYYLHELSKTEEEISVEITRDESSPHKRRLRNWGKIQALRDKAYSLHTHCKPIASDCNKLIKNLDIITSIFARKDEQTKKYYNAIFDNEQISQKMMGHFGYKIRNFLLFCNSTFTDVLFVILGFLLFANNFYFFMMNNDFPFHPLVLLGYHFVLSLVLAFIPFCFIICPLLDGTTIKTAFTFAIYIINLTYVIIQLLGDYRGITLKSLVIVLIPLLIRLIPFLLLKFGSNKSYAINERSKKKYKQYYDFLDKEWRETKEYYINLVEERIETIKEGYYLDISSYSKAEEIYYSILEKYDTWANNHSVIPTQELLSKPPKLDYSRISSRKEISLRRKCPSCGYRYFDESIRKENGGSETKRERISGGYYETVEHNYDITLNGEKVGTATKQDRHYVSPEYTDYTYLKSTDYRNYSCQCCGYKWSRRGRTTTLRVSSAHLQDLQLKVINDIIDDYKKSK